MRSQIVLLALSALTAVSAQNYTINPDEVSITLRSSWCSGEYNVCNVLCDQDAAENNCDPNTLVYSCTCASNNSSPGLQYYSDSIPAHVCQQAFSDCITANVGNAAGQKNCTTSIQDNCGTLDIANFTATPTTTSAASSAASTGGSSSSTGAAASGSSATAVATSSSTAAAAPTNIQLIGNGAAAMAVGLFAYLL